MEEVRQQAYADGMAAGIVEGQNQAQADLAVVQQHMQNALMALQEAVTQREEQILTQVLSLMRVTLHQLVGLLAVTMGPELLEHHLRALLPLLKTDETLTLRVHPLARGFHEKLGLPQAAIMGVPMHIVNDATLGHTDAVILWANGGVESKLELHLAEVDRLLLGAGAQALATDHKPNLNALSVPVEADSHTAKGVPVVAPASDMDEATLAAKARANALLGDEDDLVDALK
jgi:flagellar biosynthesis/type III secretory pathway protein FliH